ncbi:hypothetical protein PCK1_001853, partial [Pneumocystis canis]
IFFQTKRHPSKSLYTRIRQIPIELYPLAMVLLIGLGGKFSMSSMFMNEKRFNLVFFQIKLILFYIAACYNLGNKLLNDPSLRRYPSKKSAE